MFAEKIVYFVEFCGIYSDGFYIIIKLFRVKKNKVWKSFMLIINRVTINSEKVNIIFGLTQKSMKPS